MTLPEYCFLPQGPRHPLTPLLIRFFLGIACSSALTLLMGRHLCIQNGPLRQAACIILFASRDLNPALMHKADQKIAPPRTRLHGQSRIAAESGRPFPSCPLAESVVELGSFCLLTTIPTGRGEMIICPIPDFQASVHNLPTPPFLRFSSQPGYVRGGAAHSLIGPKE